MTATKKAHEIVRYSDGKQIGYARLSQREYQGYLNFCQEPEGLVKLGDLPIGCVELNDGIDNDDNLTVYLED